MLAAIRPAIAMPVPELELFDSPHLFSRHRKLAGGHLLSADYEGLIDEDRQHLAAAMANFFAQLHALDADRMAVAGAAPLAGWPDAGYLNHRALPLLPPAQRDLARRTIEAWQNLLPDPQEITYGFFDGHGWNMAFDHARKRLNGIYDFADSGFGPLHQSSSIPA